MIIRNFAVMRQIVRHIFISLIVLTVGLLWPTGAHAGSQPLAYNTWKTFDSERLLETARGFANTPGKGDSALLCASVLTERYDERMTDSEKNVIARGYHVKAYVYLFIFYDLSRAYESLLHASAICRETHYELPAVYMDYGHLYSNIGEQGGGKEALRKALYYMRKSFYAALHQRSYNTLNTAFGNAISMAWELNLPHTLDREWEIYRKVKNGDKPEFTKFNMLYYEAYQKVVKGDLDGAISIFGEQATMMPDDDSHVRYTAEGLFNMARVQKMKGRYDDALANLRKVETLAVRYGMKDVSTELYEEMWNVMRMKGDSTGADKYHSKYLAAKEEMINYQQVAGLKELSFMESLRRQNEKIAAERTEKMMVQWAAAILLLIVAIVSAFVVVLVRKNKRLRESNEALYNKVQEGIAETTADTDGSKAVKYKDSRLDEADKAAIYRRACEVMDNGGEILHVDFSIRRLAELVGTNYRNMSQVINEKAHCNFNTFLNQYRIRHACKMMNDVKTYGNYTIEGYSTSVGFKSRNTFVTSFKRVTGLTPSEYLRINRSKQNAADTVVS